MEISSLFNVKGKVGKSSACLGLSGTSSLNRLSRAALVTGGGSGIGKMIASALVANGARVYIAARKEGQLKAVSRFYVLGTSSYMSGILKATDELNAAGPGECHYVVADLTVRYYIIM